MFHTWLLFSQSLWPGGLGWGKNSPSWFSGRHPHSRLSASASKPFSPCGSAGPFPVPAKLVGPCSNLPVIFASQAIPDRQLFMGSLPLFSPPLSWKTEPLRSPRHQPCDVSSAPQPRVCRSTWYCHPVLGTKFRTNQLRASSCPQPEHSSASQPLHLGNAYSSFKS